MRKFMDDPVLNLTASALHMLRWAALAFAAVTFVIAVLIAVVAAAMTFGGYTLPENASVASMRDMITGLGLMVSGTALFFMMSRFTGALRDLVLSVGEGQPLSLVNAGRLRAMGWITILVQLLVIVMIATGLFGLGSAWDVDTAYDLIEGALMAAVLFILARIFEHGARMQEELEGTV